MILIVVCGGVSWTAVIIWFKLLQVCRLTVLSLGTQSTFVDEWFWAAAGKLRFRLPVRMNCINVNRYA